MSHSSSSTNETTTILASSNISSDRNLSSHESFKVESSIMSNLLQHYFVDMDRQKLSPKDRLFDQIKATFSVGFFSTKSVYKRDGWKEILRQDLIAGFTVGSLVIPQAMAYAALAGLDPQYGLFSAIFPPLIYFIFATSPFLSVAPVALLSLLVSNSVLQVVTLENGNGPIDPNHYTELAIALTFLTGIVQLSLGLFKVGGLAQFLSHPVLSGFSSAAAILIGSSQLKSLFGVNISRHEYFHDTIIDFFSHIGETHWATLGLGIFSIAFLAFFKAWKKKKWKHWEIVQLIPFPLIILIIGAIVTVSTPDSGGIAIVGEIPNAPPSIQWPFTGVSFSEITALIPSAFVIGLVGFLESISVGKKFASEFPDEAFSFDEGQELISYGFVNLITPFFQGYATTGGFSRSAVQQAAGAKTQLTGVVSSILVILTLSFLTPLIKWLPKTGLAAVILLAIVGLIDTKEPIRLWKVSRSEFYVLLLSFLFTLFFGVEIGIGVGLVASLLSMIKNASHPHFALLGCADKTNQIFRNIKRYPESFIHPDIIQIRWDGPLFYGNSTMFDETIKNILSKTNASIQRWFSAHDLDVESTPKVKTFILEFSSIPSIDSQALHTLEELITSLETENNCKVLIVNARGPMRDFFSLSGFISHFGESTFFETSAAAYKFALSRRDKWPTQEPSLHEISQGGPANKVLNFLFPDDDHGFEDELSGKSLPSHNSPPSESNETSSSDLVSPTDFESPPKS